MNETLKRIDAAKYAVINKLKADAIHNKDLTLEQEFKEVTGWLANYSDLVKNIIQWQHFCQVLLKNLHAKPENYIDNIADALNDLFRHAEIKAKGSMN